MVVTLDVSKLTGWLNADARCGFRGGGGGLGRERRAGECAGVDLRPECVRTSNMYFMFVTPEVCQLEMSALKRVKGLRPPVQGAMQAPKRDSMSVMAATFQSAMGPYVSIAELASASNSTTAVLRSALLVKM